ncbi:MAG: TRAP transporter substrate-binding protein DctP [Acidiferrobacterales bacterium]
MRLSRIFLAAACVALFTSGANAKTLVIKLATVAPKDSTWHAYLQDINERWIEASGGQVRLKIYAGTLGDENDIMRRMRVGQVDAATVTTAGLSSVDDAAKALHIPLAFSSDAELEHVQAGLSERVGKALRDKGFVVLNWGDAGWVHFFSKAPVKTPNDLRKQKLFVWAAAEVTETEELWKKLGFRPVPLSSVDILPALQTGMISAYQAPPLAALANQWFAFTGWMTDMRWAPLTGATIITKRAWNKIPAELRPELAKIAVEAGIRLRDQVRELEKNAIDAMTKRGLQIVSVPPEALREWEALTTSIYPEIRDKIVPAQYFDEALKLRDEFRAANPASGKRKP